MRKQIFLAIANRIKEQVPEIKFIDLWNEHLADITTNTAWPTPSLFVEFEPYDVRPESRHCAMADIPVRLHVVTRAVAYTAGCQDKRLADALAYFDLLDKVHAAMASLAGENFSTFMLTWQATNHNHAELIESIDRYITRAQLTAAERKATQVVVAALKIKE